MASVLCENCSQLLKQFAVHLRRVCREFMQKVRDVFRELSHCTCFRIAPEITYLRRTTQEFPTLHHLYGRTIAALRFLCPVGSIARNYSVLFFHISCLLKTYLEFTQVMYNIRKKMFKLHLSDVCEYPSLLIYLFS